MSTMSHVFQQNLRYLFQTSFYITSGVRISCQNAVKITYCQKQTLSQHYNDNPNDTRMPRKGSQVKSSNKYRKSKPSSYVQKATAPEPRYVNDGDDNDYFGLNESSYDQDELRESSIRFPQELPTRYRVSKQVRSGSDMKETPYGHVRFDRKWKTVRGYADGRQKHNDDLYEVEMDQRSQGNRERSRNFQRAGKPKSLSNEWVGNRNLNDTDNSYNTNATDSYIDDQHFAYEGIKGTETEQPSYNDFEHLKRRGVKETSRHGKEEAIGTENFNFINAQYFNDTAKVQGVDINREIGRVPETEVSESLPNKPHRQFDDDVNEFDRQYFVNTSSTDTFQPIPDDKRIKHQTKEKERHQESHFNNRKSKNKSSSNEKPIETSAYDVAMKFRRESDQSRHVNLYGEMRPEEIDSQGYRILRNQVPHFDNAPALDVRNVLRKSILYQEGDIVAINKPYGLPSHSGPGVVHCMSDFLDSIIPKTQLYPVHRLDKETTGVMLFTKSESMARELSDRFYERDVRKRYLAITKNVPTLRSGEIDIPLSEVMVDGKVKLTLKPHYSQELKSFIPKNKESQDAVTRYRILDTGDRYALLECLPITGKKHQIRVHLAYGLDCPILGDHKYAHFNKLAPMRLHPSMLEKLHIQQSKVRHVALHLHARSIMIPNFLDGRSLFISAWLPPHFVRNMKTLKLSLPRNM